MRVVVAGSRSITDYAAVKRAVESVAETWGIEEVVSGTARGVDQLGERWAEENGVEVERFPAKWSQHGDDCRCLPDADYCPVAGPRRNREMARYADGLVAIHDGESDGTRDMITAAREEGLKMAVFSPHGVQETLW